MASKARVMGDTSTLRLILACDYDPAAIKRLGRMVTPFDADMWERMRYDLVSRGNFLKFSQNPRLRKILLATGERPLAEASGSDAIWGIGVNLRDATAGARWRGLNLLGRALMRVRTALQSQIEVPLTSFVVVAEAASAGEVATTAAADAVAADAAASEMTQATATERCAPLSDLRR